MKSKKKIIDVAPLTRISLSGNQTFSYLYDEEIKNGSLVSIPLFRRKVEGIVLKNRSNFLREGNIELKNIEKIIELDFLNKNQLLLAEFMADYYFSSLGTVLKLFVPKRVKARNSQLAIRNSQLEAVKKIILTKEQSAAVKKITKKNNLPAGRQDRQFLLFGPAGSGKTEVYINSILALRKQNFDFQFLILLPEIMLVPQAIQRYGAYFKKEEIAVVNSKISKGKLFDYWQKVKSGEIKIIIGSRMALFLPFKKLGLIAVDEEQDISFKQWDMNPRYDGRKVVEKLAEIHEAKIVFGSATPRVETFFKAEKKEYHLVKLPPLRIPEVKFSSPDVFLADMRKERWKNRDGQSNLSCISKKLQFEIAYILKNKLQAIIFVNRQGMSNFSVCVDCKTVLRCPNCDRSLVYDNEGFYACLHCSYKTSIIPQCSKCGGVSFKNIGLGTQKVEREITNFFASARIARADSQTMKKAGAEEKIYQDFSLGKIDILIGTQMISKGWDLPNVALIGIIDADNLLAQPDFLASERAFQHIAQLAGRTNRPNALFKGTVVIQTFNPENYFFKSVLENNIENFFKKELSERENLLFPPFGKIIQLIFQDNNLEKVNKECKKIYDSLKKITNENVKVSEAHLPLVPKIRGRFRKQIILKIGQKQKNIPNEITKIIKHLASNWIIDVDPISIA
jgi:primosomal protein N' (replication factor Y)